MENKVRLISPRLSPFYLLALLGVTLASIGAMLAQPQAKDTVIPIASMGITAIVTLARLEPPPDHRNADSSAESKS